MATITIEIPKEIDARVIKGFCTRNGYQDTIIASDSVTMISNPETKKAFLTRKLYEYIVSSVEIVESDDAAQQARIAVSEDIAKVITPVMKEATIVP
jgi:hypothetical protein